MIYVPALDELTDQMAIPTRIVSEHRSFCCNHLNYQRNDLIWARDSLTSCGGNAFPIIPVTFIFNK